MKLKNYNDQTLVDVKLTRGQCAALLEYVKRGSDDNLKTRDETEIALNENAIRAALKISKKAGL